MIIVSQDKTETINFDKTFNFFIVKIAEDCYKVNADGECLGNYESEERAKEVLEEITEKYENIELAKYDRTSFTTRDNFIYRMPEE